MLGRLKPNKLSCEEVRMEIAYPIHESILPEDPHWIAPITTREYYQDWHKELEIQAQKHQNKQIVHTPPIFWWGVPITITQVHNPKIQHRYEPSRNLLLHLPDKYQIFWNIPHKEKAHKINRNREYLNSHAMANFDWKSLCYIQPN